MADDQIQTEESKKLMTNRRIVLKSYGGYDQLSVVTGDADHVLRPGAGQVTVKIEACGINFSDLYTRQGLFREATLMKPPFVMGREAAGTVLDVGSNVTTLKFGLWAEYAVLESNECFALHDRMMFDDGAAFFLNYLTAHFAVFDFGNLRPGQKIFVHSVAGGVGWAATQLARTVPGVVVIGTASKWKADALKKNGVDHVIDSNDCDYIDKVLAMFPQGVDVVLDNRSGIDFVHAQRLLGQMGRIVHLGASGAVGGEHRSTFGLLKLWWGLKHVPVIDLISNNRAVCGFHLDVLRSKAPQAVRRASDSLMALYDGGHLSPNIDSIWTFEQVWEANEHLTNRKSIGKVIIKP